MAGNRTYEIFRLRFDRNRLITSGELSMIAVRPAPSAGAAANRMSAHSPLPSNSNFAERIRSQVASSPVCAFYGLCIDDIAPGAADLSIALRAELGHRPGFFQGSVIAALADYAGSLANMTMTPADWSLLTLDFTIKFTGAAEGERLIGRGRVASAGTSLSVANVEVLVRRDGADTPCAIALLTTRQRPIRN